MYKPELFCRVCGYFYGIPIWGENGDSPLHDICPCCGTEFGYEDFSKKAVILNRKKWEIAGRIWFNRKKMPSDWSYEKQYLNIDEQYR